MWKLIKLILLITIIYTLQASYLEFKLKKEQEVHKGFQLEPVHCQNQDNITSDAQYKEICYQKDIAYHVHFTNNNHNVFLAADFTVPISWLKGEDCKIQDSQKPCNRLVDRIGEKLKEVKTKIVKKLKKSKKVSHEIQNSIIEGSSQTIRGQIEKSQNVTFRTKDSSRLSNFFQIIMLGLFIYGEKDTLLLQNTNFINATSISSNLNLLADGAISLRFDSASENSFINEIFTYTKATQKTICIYLGNNNSLTIGDLTTKYTKQGFSGINWISMPDDEGYGKLAQVSAVGLDFTQEDEHQEDSETIPAVFTLSASYIGLPETILTTLIKALHKHFDCSINSKTFYLECKHKDKKDLKDNANLYFTLDEHNLLIPLSSLILQQKSKTITFNIKKTFNNRIILGEPVFQMYTLIFDYSNNKIGFSEKRAELNSFFISVVHLIRIICTIFVIGLVTTVFYNPVRNCLKSGGYNKSGGLLQPRKKQYAPIQQNPYEDLNSKIQDAINSTDRQVDGI